MKLNNATERIDITLTVPSSEPGGQATVIKGTYSLATYIDAVSKLGDDVKIAKALYSFGLASKAYRDTLG